MSTHWPALQMPLAQSLGAWQGCPVLALHTPAVGVVLGGHLQMLVGESQEEPVGVPQVHFVAPMAPFVEPEAHWMHGGAPVARLK